jgi:citrate lyase subunit beta/citryl-CoA lyase
MNTERLPISFLFVPGDRPERYAKAVASGADAIIIDLEDSVAAADKERARDACARHFASGATAFIRINGLDTEWVRQDLALLGLTGVLGVVMPKAERAAQLATLRQHTPHHVPLLPLIESAAGLAGAAAIGAAPGVQRLIFGSVDFCLDLGIEHDAELLAPYRAMLVLAARAAALPGPIDGVTLAFDDPVALEHDSVRARRAGFGGKLCIHPAQVAGVNASFLPSGSDLAWALEVLAMAREQGGAFAFEGAMVDAPVLARALKLVQTYHCWP